MRACRKLFCALALLLLCTIGNRAHAQQAPAAEKSPIELASDLIGDIGRCRQPGANPLNATCAIQTFHQAGNILRDAGINPEDEPNTWWTIYEGLGTGFAQLGKYDKALSFYKLAGAIRKAPARAREESAYYIGRVQHEMGQMDEALHTFDTLFTMNKNWIEQAERDPLLADLRRTEQWQNMMRYYIKEQQKEAATPQEPKPEKQPSE